MKIFTIIKICFIINESTFYCPKSFLRQLLKIFLMEIQKWLKILIFFNFFFFLNDS